MTRVLVISHNCVGESNRKRIAALAALPDLEVALLTPTWWFEEGRRIDLVEPTATAYHWTTGRTLATNNGTRHLYLTGLLSAVRSLQPDVIDLHEEPFSLVALQVLLARNLLAPRAALVFCSYVNVHRRWRQPYQSVEDLLLRSADAAYAPNTDVPPILRAKGLRAPAWTIASGVDVERFANAIPMDLGSRLEDAPRPYVGFLGRLEPVKGLDYLLEAAAAVTVAGTIVIAGDGPERPRLQEMVVRLRLDKRIRFLPGMPFIDVPPFIRSLDAVVLPSITIPPEHKEQFGRVLTEAMAAGVPVVGSTSGAIPEVIGEAGLVVPERDAASLATALSSIMADPQLRADLSARGRERVAAHYAWPIVAAQAADLYSLAIERRRSPHPAGALDHYPQEVRP